MMPIKAVIAKLEAWSYAPGDFHSDRQLADEILIADGWKPVADETFQGGVRWEYRTSGSGMTLCSSEGTRPHPINDMNAAIGVVPCGVGWSISFANGQAVADVHPKPGMTISNVHDLRGVSERPAVAITIAALKYLAMVRNDRG